MKLNLQSWILDSKIVLHQKVGSHPDGRYIFSFSLRFLACHQQAKPKIVYISRVFLSNQREVKTRRYNSDQNGQKGNSSWLQTSGLQLGKPGHTHWQQPASAVMVVLASLLLQFFPLGCSFVLFLDQFFRIGNHSLLPL